MGICGFDFGCFDLGGFDGFVFVGFDIEDLAIGGGINRDSSGTSESINRGLVLGGIILLVSPSLSDGLLFEAGINTSSQGGRNWGYQGYLEKFKEKKTIQKL